MIDRLDRWLARTESACIAAGTGVAAALATVQVVLRYAFGMGIYWAEEVVVYCIIWTAFIAASAAIRSNDHLSVEIIRMFAPARLAATADRLASIIGAAAGLSLMVLGAQLVRSAYEFEQQSSALEMPMWLVYLIIPISGALMALRFVHRCFFASAQSENG